MEAGEMTEDSGFLPCGSSLGGPDSSGAADRPWHCASHMAVDLGSNNTANVSGPHLVAAVLGFLLFALHADAADTVISRRGHRPLTAVTLARDSSLGW